MRCSFPLKNVVVVVVKENETKRIIVLHFREKERGRERVNRWQKTNVPKPEHTAGGF